MSSPDIESAPLLFGNSGLFGIRTTPAGSATPLALITLNAGMLPCAGPFRLHVDLAHAVSRLGITTVRLDQSGKGESPVRPGVSAADAALLDYDDVFTVLSRYGVEKTILMGICSGAVDALRIAAERPSVAGLILLDGFVGLTAGWHRRRLAERARNAITAGPYATLRRLIRGRPEWKKDDGSSILTDLSDWGKLDLRPEYASVLQRDVEVLAIFAGEFFPYRYSGQLRDYLSPATAARGLEEVFFAEADHTYMIVRHRRRLIATMIDWLGRHYVE